MLYLEVFYSFGTSHSALFFFKKIGEHVNEPANPWVFWYVTGTYLTLGSMYCMSVESVYKKNPKMRDFMYHALLLSQYAIVTLTSIWTDKQFSGHMKINYCIVSFKLRPLWVCNDILRRNYLFGCSFVLLLWIIWCSSSIIYCSLHWNPINYKAQTHFFVTKELTGFFTHPSLKSNLACCMIFLIQFTD